MREVIDLVLQQLQATGSLGCRPGTSWFVDREGWNEVVEQFPNDEHDEHDGHELSWIVEDLLLDASTFLHFLTTPLPQAHTTRLIIAVFFLFAVHLLLSR